MFQTLRRFLLGLPFFLCACADDGTCKIASVGDLQVLNSRGSPIVKASVNGHPVAFIVDSGAQFSSIWPNQVDKLGLVSQFRQVRMRGVGGETMGDIVIADKLGLGSATASDVPFIAVGNLFDGHAIDGLPVVGLFGADFLSSYDVIFDLPEHRINLYDIHGCKKQLPEWQSDFSKIEVEHWWRDSTMRKRRAFFIVSIVSNLVRFVSITLSSA
ncbi:retropepsin-like aspartic protease family protein [Kozakia baliensis]|uniref:retropepsin-like aspartic protease family protein n=1 Tax=Kozakia baliensis TaxID=153496 RepID=UPI000689C132|nr:retropepsin-like aspartic protease [Kozakia baliensis]